MGKGSRALHPQCCPPHSHERSVAAADLWPGVCGSDRVDPKGLVQTRPKCLINGVHQPTASCTQPRLLGDLCLKLATGMITKNTLENTALPLRTGAPPSRRLLDCLALPYNSSSTPFLICRTPCPMALPRYSRSDVSVDSVEGRRVPANWGAWIALSTDVLDRAAHESGRKADCRAQSRRHQG